MVIKHCTEADIEKQTTWTMKRLTKVSTGNCLGDFAISRKNYEKVNLQNQKLRTANQK